MPNPTPDPASTAAALRPRVLPTPDQGRYGPPGTTDSPRYRADGVTPWPREDTNRKGDPRP